jgi:uncharacterized protein (TIGR00106 family)
MVLVEFSMFPIDKRESLSPYVARSIEIIEQSGIDYRLHAMGTILEGEWDEVFDVIRKCFLRMAEDCNRISAVIKVDYRKGPKGRIQAKVRSVEEKLGKTLKK